MSIFSGFKRIFQSGTTAAKAAKEAAKPVAGAVEGLRPGTVKDLAEAASISKLAPLRADTTTISAKLPTDQEVGGFLRSILEGLPPEKQEEFLAGLQEAAKKNK